MGNICSVKDVLFSSINGVLSGNGVVLESIANQCPLSGGDAVYEARALLGEAVNYDDEELCISALERKSSIAALENTNLSILPNPSTGKFWITGVLESSVKVRVFNSQGNLVVESTEAAIDLSGQAPGFYFVEI